MLTLEFLLHGYELLHEHMERVLLSGTTEEEVLQLTVRWVLAKLGKKESRSWWKLICLD